MVGEERCPIVDTWWQTETGGILITPLPGATKLKPGSATLPFFGVQPAIVDADGKVLTGECTGNLCIAKSWPGQMRTVYGDHDRFEQTYFSTYKGKYFTGDGCRRDDDGYYWITGRVDDVINVSGHRMGTAEVESALVAHAKVAEAAVVGYPHDIKGQGIYAYVTLKTGDEPSEELRKELVAWVRKEIGPIASPDLIQCAPGLPKTRSGKIMRRILRKIAEDELGASATPRPWPIRPWSTIWCSTARTRRTHRLRVRPSHSPTWGKVGWPAARSANPLPPRSGVTGFQPLLPRAFLRPAARSLAEAPDREGTKAARIAPFLALQSE